MSNIDSQLESVLFYQSEPVSVKTLSGLLGAKPGEVSEALARLAEAYKERGIVLVSDGEVWSLGTHPSNSALIEKLQKDEVSRELGRAGLETLAVILYRGPISRREIDQIRGVNSGFILRNLLIRGLIERAGDPPASTSEASRAGRSFTYKPTLKLFEHLGVTGKEALPEYERAFASIENFVAQSGEENNEAA